MRSRLSLTLLPLLALLVMLGRSAAAQGQDGPFPPHRIAGNLYYVGSQKLASYLITTPQGNILINSCFPETVPLIQDSVKKLGFRFEDVKILLTSHAHNDHVAGNALVRRLTHARVMVMEGDEGIVQEGGKGDFQYNSTWEPCPVDLVLKDGATVKLGDAVLTARKTAGHTRGCTTWTMNVKDEKEGGKTLRAVIIGSPNVNPGYKLVNNTQYPTIAQDYARTFKVLKSLPVDLFLGAHGDYYGLADKYAQLQQDRSKNPFIDPEGYHRYVSERQTAFETELAKQKGGE